MISAAAALVVVLVAGGVPTGPRAAAARAEAEAFLALEERRDCDAARSFLAAHDLARDPRLLVNAGLALERAGDVDAARAVYATAGDAARGNALPAHGTATCAGVPPATAGQVGGDAVVEVAPAAVDGAPLWPAGAAIAGGGLVVASAAVGVWAWLDRGVLADPASPGDAKLVALTAAPVVLVAGAVAGGALVVAGALVAPFSLPEAAP